MLKSYNKFNQLNEFFNNALKDLFNSLFKIASDRVKQNIQSFQAKIKDSKDLNDAKMKLQNQIDTDNKQFISDLDATTLIDLPNLIKDQILSVYAYLSAISQIGQGYDIFKPKNFFNNDINGLNLDIKTIFIKSGKNLSEGKPIDENLILNYLEKIGKTQGLKKEDFQKNNEEEQDQNKNLSDEMKKELIDSISNNFYEAILQQTIDMIKDVTSQKWFVDID
jgi:hypothetical protein